MVDIYPDLGGMYVEGNIGWFISRVDNILYQIDIEKRECTFLAALPETGTDNWRGNPTCFKWEDKIVCLPNRSHFVWIYGLEDKQFESIEMPKRIERWNICFYTLKRKLLYMISGASKLIVVADLEKMKIDKIINLNSANDIDSITGIAVHDTSIFYIANGAEAYVYEFDADTEQISKRCAIVDDNKYDTLAFDGTSFWLSGRKRELLEINQETNRHKKIDFECTPENFKQYNFEISGDDETEFCIEHEEYMEPLFGVTFACKDKVWFFPLGTSHILYVDLYSHEVVPVELENEEETIESIRKRGFLRTYKYFFERIENDGKLVVYSLKNDCHYVIDGDTGKCIETFKDYKITNYDLLIEQLATDKSILYEKYPTDREIYKYRLCNQTEKEKKS